MNLPQQQTKNKRVIKKTKQRKQTLPLPPLHTHTHNIGATRSFNRFGNSANPSTIKELKELLKQHTNTTGREKQNINKNMKRKIAKTSTHL